MTDRTKVDARPGDEIDTIPGPGLRSDQAGSGTSLAGPAPGGGAASQGLESETRSDPDVPAGDATGASGGFGTGSERSSGGTGDGQDTAGEDPQTDWLREAPGASGSS